MQRHGPTNRRGNPCDSKIKQSSPSRCQGGEGKRSLLQKCGLWGWTFPSHFLALVPGKREVFYLSDWADWKSIYPLVEVRIKIKLKMASVICLFCYNGSLSSWTYWRPICWLHSSFLKTWRGASNCREVDRLLKGHYFYLSFVGQEALWTKKKKTPCLP